MFNKRKWIGLLMLGLIGTQHSKERHWKNLGEQWPSNDPKAMEAFWYGMAVGEEAAYKIQLHDLDPSGRLQKHLKTR